MILFSERKECSIYFVLFTNVCAVKSLLDLRKCILLFKNIFIWETDICPFSICFTFIVCIFIFTEPDKKFKRKTKFQSHISFSLLAFRFCVLHVLQLLLHAFILSFIYSILVNQSITGKSDQCPFTHVLCLLNFSKKWSNIKKIYYKNKKLF